MWISVNERLPSVGQIVLCMTSDGEVVSAEVKRDVTGRMWSNGIPAKREFYLHTWGFTGCLEDPSFTDVDIEWWSEYEVPQKADRRTESEEA